jgi:hypothetical protein
MDLKNKNAGVSERTCMQITGHLARSMFDRHNITSEKDLAHRLLTEAEGFDKGGSENYSSKTLRTLLGRSASVQSGGSTVSRRLTGGIASRK